MRAGIDNTNQESQALAAACAATALTQLHLNRTLREIPPHERPPTAETAAKAEEVFSTPELLEAILLCGRTTREKLKAMRISRCRRHTVLGSLELMRSLGLGVAHPRSFYYSP